MRPALKAAGITKPFRPLHDLRHTALTHEAAAGNPQAYVQPKAGHTQSTITDATSTPPRCSSPAPQRRPRPACSGRGVAKRVAKPTATGATRIRRAPIRPYPARGHALGGRMGGGFQRAAVTMRRLAACLLPGVFAISWLVLPGFGLIDLSVTWDADWPQVLEAGWGLFATAIVGAAFLLLAVRPRVSVPAAAQLVAATGSLAVSAVVARETGLLVLAGLLGLQTAIVGGLLRRAWRDGTELWGSLSRISRPLLLLAAFGAIPWFGYALHMWSLNREERSDSDITMGIDHYAMQEALALVLVVLPLLAALRADLHPFVPVCAGAAAGYLDSSPCLARRGRWALAGVVDRRDGMGARAGRRRVRSSNPFRAARCLSPGRLRATGTQHDERPAIAGLSGSGGGM